MVASVSYLKSKNPKIQTIFRLLEKVVDPEIPAVHILELGIVRGVEEQQNEFVIKITPTYSGCPAIEQIKDDIITTLRHNGFDNIKIVSVLKPAWSTDMMWISAKEKLKNVGIAPPCQLTMPTCPLCGASVVEEINHFGSTACKALYRCLQCKEPFDYFKTH